MPKGNTYQSYCVVCKNTKDDIVNSISFSKHSEALKAYSEFKRNAGKNIVSVSMVGIKEDNTQKVMFKKDIQKSTSSTFTITNPHISEVNPKNELKTILNSLDLIQKKLEYATEANDLYNKEQDCELHRIEELDIINFETEEEEINYKLSIIDNIRNIRRNRRIAKNHMNECKEILAAFNGFTLKKTPFLKTISDKEYNYSLSDGHRTKVYTFTYKTEEEKNLLIENLKRNYSKVLNVSEGIIKCYNKCGEKKISPISNHSNKTYTTPTNTSQVKKETIHKEQSINTTKVNPVPKPNINSNPFNLPSIIDTIKYNITECIVAGKKIPTTKPGTSICIKRIPQTSVNHIKESLGQKYQEVVYYPEVQMLILHNRLDK